MHYLWGEAGKWISDSVGQSFGNKKRQLHNNGTCSICFGYVLVHGKFSLSLAIPIQFWWSNVNLDFYQPPAPWGSIKRPLCHSLTHSLTQSLTHSHTLALFRPHRNLKNWDCLGGSISEWVVLLWAKALLFKLSLKFPRPGIQIRNDRRSSGDTLRQKFNLIYLWHLTFDIEFLTFVIWHMAYDTWHLTFNQWINGKRDKWTNGQMDKWTNGPMDRLTNWPMDQLTNGHSCKKRKNQHRLIFWPTKLAPKLRGLRHLQIRDKTA